jgi:hypothetical protein
MKLYTTMLREVEDSTIPEVQRTNLDSIIAENVDHHRQDRSSTSFDPGFTKRNS